MMKPGREKNVERKKKSPEEKSWINDEVVWVQLVCVCMRES